MARMVTFRLVRVVRLACFVAVVSSSSACFPPATANSESSDSAALKGMTLEQLSARWQSLKRIQPPPPAFMSSIVFHHNGDKQEAYTDIARWCRANGGREDFEVSAGECPSYEKPNSGCFGEAAWHYSARHGNAAFSSGACVKQDGSLSAAILSFDNSQVALYAGAELSAFVEKYVEVGKTQQKAWKEQADKKSADDRAAFDQAVLALDAAKDPSLSGVPSARDSVDFLREKLKEGVGRTRLSDFGNPMMQTAAATNPCQFTSESEHQNPTVLELGELDLNLGDTVTTLTRDRFLGHPNGEQVPVFQLKLATKSGVGYAEFNDVDTAKRCAKAFVALARRCGAKPDTRFK
jgi:hypothetical protein